MHPRALAPFLALCLSCSAVRDPSIVPAPGDAAPTPPDAAPEVESLSIDAKLLVLSADGSETLLAAIRQALDFQGTPYTVWIAAQAPLGLTAQVLAEETHGFYQGVILAGGDVPLGESEWQALRSYQARFGVRQATWFAAPTPEGGFGAATRSRTPIAATLTPAGRAVFPYLVGKLTIDGVDAFLAAAADDRTVPLLVDDAGHALVAVKTYPDGRQNLALTFDGNASLVHTIALSSGVVAWVTRGLFIGEKHVYVGPQVDDVFLGNALFTEGVYRIDGDDLRAVASWQRTVQQRATTRGLVLTLAFNGMGTTGMYAPDTLTPAAHELQGEFRWVSHTFTHQDLDAADYATTAFELGENQELATKFPLDEYSGANLVTPGHSGLANPEAMRAASDRGIAFLISNTSRPGHDNPFPNVGIPNAFQPELFEIPRHPTEIYFDVTTPDEEVIEYAARRPGRTFSYDEILERESDHLLRYMLIGDMDPWMFHQSNLRAYDGTHTLLLDLLDRTLDKYEAIYNLPVQALAMDDLGARMAERTELHASGAGGILVPGRSLTLTVTRDATVPVTGLPGQAVARVRVTAGTPVTITLP